MGRQGHSLMFKSEHLSRKRYRSVEQVPHHTSTGALSIGNRFMRFESRESTFNQILEALRGDCVSRVALYGMCGIGKTALAKQVGKTAKDLGIFNMVAFVSMTTIPNVKYIQDEIVEQFGWRLEEEEEADPAVRQRQVSRRLRNAKRVLVILDNVWQRLDLEEIGILNDGSQMGCKVLLTTRNRQVGYLMGCQRSIHLSLLTDEEAWNFFRKRAGIDDESHFDSIAEAKEVAKHCQGLPFAIVALALSLRGRCTGQCPRGKGLIWEDDSSNFILQMIQVNYDALSSKVAKAIFLMCGLFPEDHEIPIEDLSHCAVRIGLCDKNEVNAAINNLKDRCLLMQSDKSNENVIMHRLYRDTAVMVVYKENSTHRDSVREHTNALYHENDFRWNEELDGLLRQLYGVTEYPSSTSNAADGVNEYPSSSTSYAANDVTEYPSSSTSNAANCVIEHSSSSTSNASSYGGKFHELQVVRSYSDTKAAATVPKPSGELVDFYGLCQVDKLFLPLLKEACAVKPQLIVSQSKHSEMLRHSAFGCLGSLLFLLRNVRYRDLLYYKHELEMFWEQVKVTKFDLEWLSPFVEGVLSSSEIARIEALEDEEKYWKGEAAKLREQLKVVEDKASYVRTEIALTETKLDGFAIAYVSKA